ncbi:MAG: hypothetical protein J5382_01980 [Bacteroidales bacterium]|nr:hypothetical protein [Bacteroidales bacterium]
MPDCSAVSCGVWEYLICPVHGLQHGPAADANSREAREEMATIASAIAQAKGRVLIKDIRIAKLPLYVTFSKAAFRRAISARSHFFFEINDED